MPAGALEDTTTTSSGLGTTAVGAGNSDGGSGLGSSSQDPAIIAASVIAAVVFIAVSVCVALFVLRKRRRRAALQELPDPVVVSVDPEKLEGGKGLGGSGRTGLSMQDRLGSGSMGNPSNSRLGIISQPESTATGTDTFDWTVGGQRTLQPPDGGATTDQRLDFVALQLESIAGQTVANGLVLDVGDSSRVRGGVRPHVSAVDRSNCLLFGSCLAMCTCLMKHRLCIDFH